MTIYLAETSIKVLLESRYLVGELPVPNSRNEGGASWSMGPEIRRS